MPSGPLTPPSLRTDVRSDDCAAVRRLAASSGFFRPDEIDVAVELVEARLKQGSASGYDFLFAESGGDVVGYACYGPIGCTVGSFDLYWIIVAPEAQGAGIGRRLMSEVERMVRAAGGRRLYAETSNRPQYHPTREFYRRCGYRVEAVLPDFYDEGDDKVVLAKDLRGSAETASGLP